MAQIPNKGMLSQDPDTIGPMPQFLIDDARARDKARAEGKAPSPAHKAMVEAKEAYDASEARALKARKARARKARKGPDRVSDPIPIEDNAEMASVRRYLARIGK